MNLSSKLVSEFAKITNDSTIKKEEDSILYGTVVQYEDSMCVKLDGSNEITPAITTSTIKAGDRVSVTLKKHTAIITGNLSDPSASGDDVKKVWVEITDMGVVFHGLSDGTTIINGNCIQTGTIDAQFLNLTGAIRFIDLSQEIIDEFAEITDLANQGINDANDAWDEAYDARNIARSIADGEYLNGTFIDGKIIQSPTIEGNEIIVHGTFQTADYSGNITGYMGAAQGLDGEGNDTFGVALSYQWNPYTCEISDKYVIVTDSGVRLQAGSNSIVVTPGTIGITTENGYATYNGAELGTARFA